MHPHLGRDYRTGKEERVIENKQSLTEELLQLSESEPKFFLSQKGADKLAVWLVDIYSHRLGGEYSHYSDDELRQLNLEAMAKSAIEKGKPAAQLTLAKTLGQIVDKQELTHKFEVSPDEYISIGKRLIERLRQQVKECGGSCPVCGIATVLSEQIREDTGQDIRDSPLAVVATSGLPLRLSKQT